MSTPGSPRQSLDAADAARRGALLVRPGLATLVVRGGDRIGWLNGLVTCDLTGLVPGQGRWGLVLNKQGKVQHELCIVAGDQSLYVGYSTAAAAPEPLAAYLDRYLIMEDAEIEDASDRYEWLWLHGPCAAVAAERVEARQAWGNVDLTGLGGAALVVRRDAAEAAVAAVLSAPEAVLANPEDWRTLRVERTLPELGVDYHHSDNPHEASLDRRAVSWTKGCYLGQEVVCMQDMRGKVKRRIVTLVLDGEGTPVPGSAVQTADGQTAGELTTAVWSERLGKPAALARLGAAFVEPGIELIVGDRHAWILDRPA